MTEEAPSTVIPDYRILRREPGEVYVVEHRWRDWRRIFGWRRHHIESLSFIGIEEKFSTLAEAETYVEVCRKGVVKEWLRKRFYPQIVKDPA